MKCVLKILALMAIPGMAAAGNCLPVVGTVRLDPEDCTKINDYYKGQVLTFLGNNPQVYGPGPWCFKTTLKLLGFGTSTGYSGVTSESLNGYAPTPALAPSGQSILTARSWLPIPGTKDSYGQYTEIFASEIIIGSPNRVTEQSVIMKTNGKGIFKDINGGGFVILGDTRGREVPIQGEFCFP
ncbi:MAG: hypothetical protein RKO24_14955 [Candidatus Competibacter sp.]|nr:hypothetical protein [Candidatus Competibacter sp.]